MVGARESEPAEQIEAIFQDAIVAKKEGVETEGRKKKEEKIERPMPRATEADKTGDLRSLNRALTRTLYLIVKGSDERAPWEFPTSPLLGNESLHTVH